MYNKGHTACRLVPSVTYLEEAGVAEARVFTLGAQQRAKVHATLLAFL